MSKRAEELGTAFANELRGVFPDGAPEAIVNSAIESLAGALTEMIDGYGQEVREAAAKVADKSADAELDDNAAGGAYSAAEAIREMPLP